MDEDDDDDDDDDGGVNGITVEYSPSDLHCLPLIYCLMVASIGALVGVSWGSVDDFFDHCGSCGYWIEDGPIPSSFLTCG